MKKHIDYATFNLVNEADAEQVAKVNHLDNFTLHYATRAVYWIIDSMEANGGVAEKCVNEYNALCKECYTKPNARGHTDFSPYQSPTIRALCKVAYDDLNASW